MNNAVTIINKVTCFQSVFLRTLIDFKSKSRYLNNNQANTIDRELISIPNSGLSQTASSHKNCQQINSAKTIAGIAGAPKNRTGRTLPACGIYAALPSLLKSVSPSRGSTNNIQQTNSTQ